MARLIVFFLSLILLNSMKAASQLGLVRTKDTVEKNISLKPLPQNFYSQHTGYFSKKELQLQKATSLPLYIRLGSKDYVDYLEKKPNALKKE